jgi:uncharacterized BrkB/YihY/UPF0761 family membrane protein
MSQIWNGADADRPDWIQRSARSVAFLCVLGSGCIVTTALAGFGTFGRHHILLGIPSEALAVVANIGTYFGAFRVLTPKFVHSRQLLPGAVLGGIAWTVLLALGGYLIGHDLKNASATYGTFAAVLGLVAWVYMGAQLTIYAAELNVVLAQHLWPRSMVKVRPNV